MSDVPPSSSRTAGSSTTPPHPMPDPAPPGPRAEPFVIVAQLLGDLASIPFHFVMFLFTRRRVRRAFRQALDESTR